MNIQRTSKSYVAMQFWGIVIPLVMLLIASVFFNLQQNRIIQRDRSEGLVLKHKIANLTQKEAEWQHTLAQKKLDRAASDARVQELYRDIYALTRLNEKVVGRGSYNQDSPPKTDKPAVRTSDPGVRGKMEEPSSK